MSGIKRSEDGNKTFFKPYVAYVTTLGLPTQEKAKELLSVKRPGKGRPSESEQFRLDAARIALNLGPTANLHPEPEKAATSGSASKFILVKLTTALAAGTNLIVDFNGKILETLIPAPSVTSSPVVTVAVDVSPESSETVAPEASAESDEDKAIAEMLAADANQSNAEQSEAATA